MKNIRVYLICIDGVYTIILKYMPHIKEDDIHTQIGSKWHTSKGKSVYIVNVYKINSKYYTLTNLFSSVLCVLYQS